jgi:hypothetical protein
VTASLVGEQYAALAAELGLVGPRVDTTSAVSTLRGHGRWLLVLDNLTGRIPGPRLADVRSALAEASRPGARPG